MKFDFNKDYGKEKCLRQVMLLKITTKASFISKKSYFLVFHSLTKFSKLATFAGLTGGVAALPT